ncbi:MAG TPA: adenylate/guanylate cyclase domain-containing protein [Actinomycetota bacterium]
MARLSSSDRARLPDSAFAYVDSRGRRRLPINDESHVRNALARFERVAFEDEAARERARRRLLNAAKRYGILPVGFITGQLRAERTLGAADGRTLDAATLPTGFVTFLLTDIEGSTGLLERLGDRYAALLKDVRDIVRGAVLEAGGREVDSRADEFFAAFARPAPAIVAAVAMQGTLGERSWPDDVQCRVRIGIHSGRPSLTDTGYVGLAVHTAARICTAAHGAQIVVSGQTRTALRGSVPAGVRLHNLGAHRLPGLTRAETLFQVKAKGLPTDFPPLRTVPAPAPEGA